MPSCYIQKEKPADLTKAPKTGQTKRIYPGLRDGDLGFGKICRTIFDRTLPSPSRAKAETFFLTQKVPSLGNILARCLKITPSFGFCRCAPVIWIETARAETTPGRSGLGPVLGLTGKTCSPSRQICDRAQPDIGSSQSIGTRLSLGRFAVDDQGQALIVAGLMFWCQYSI